MAETPEAATAPAHRETVADIERDRDNLRTAFREMGPYLDRLQSLSQRLGWPLGEPLLKAAVEQIERDHPRHVH